ncbi:T9SS type A sorting domain-containing protein [Hymenobacter sp. ASUV-10]|uniref:T9SS type A sorting domain-containing protein n=1 Tax=Hymenobacter aranciens TaxID=3063996 RepID=A0ABT9B517_9BACT|nr:T9SS type A sorting domain-containing protein [Hymenobacter sp. ASUV-10]MDO7873366.1 T9SS type A sorting domain-containing protein [Hymenobacter sp. ASUV-10]
MQHRILTLLAGLPLLAHTAGAQAPGWTDATLLGTLNPAASVNDNGFTPRATATDAQGNVWLAGGFYGTVNFGAIRLTSVGPTDAVVLKWNPATNTVAWAQQIGGIGREEFTALTLRGGVAYLTGAFASPTVAVGPAMLTNAEGSATFAPRNVMVLKLTDAGNTAQLNWAQQLGTTGDEAATAIAERNGSVYVAGAFNSTALQVGPSQLTADPNGDGYVARLTDNGSSAAWAWALPLGGTGRDDVLALALGSTAVYVAGQFASPSLRVGGHTLTNTSLPSFNPAYLYSDGFVLRLTDAGSSGVVDWVQQTTGLYGEQFAALAVHGNTLYTALNFGQAGATVGAVALSSPANAVRSASDAGVAVVKLTDTGTASTAVWGVAGGGAGNQYARGLAVRGTDVYLAGDFRSDTLALGGFRLPNVPGIITYSNTFLSRITDGGTTGRVAWAQQYGGFGSEEVAAVALAGNRVYVAGWANSPNLQVGARPLPIASAQSAGVLAWVTDPALLGTAALALPSAFSVGPNPAHGRALVQLAAATAPGAPTTLTLLDALGRSMRTATLPATTTSHPLDLAGLTPGLYLVRLTANGTTATQRLVVE